MAHSYARCAATCLGIFVLRAAAFDATQGIRVPQPPVALQPLAQQARRVETTLAYLGQPIAAADHRLIDDAMAVGDEEEGVRQVQTALDKYVLAVVRINPESRVSVEQGPAAPELVESGTRVFLVKVLNESGVTAPLRVDSPNSGDAHFPGLCDVLRSAGHRHRVGAVGQPDRLAVRAVYLRLERKVGRKTLRLVWIDAAEAVPDQE